MSYVITDKCLGEQYAIFPIVRRNDGKIGGAQTALQEVTRGGIVIDDQHGADTTQFGSHERRFIGAIPCCASSRLSRHAVCLCDSCGNTNGKSRSGAQCTLDANLATQQYAQTTAQCQAEAGTTILPCRGWVGLREFRKQAAGGFAELCYRRRSIFRNY